MDAPRFSTCSLLRRKLTNRATKLRTQARGAAAAAVAPCARPVPAHTQADVLGRRGTVPFITTADGSALGAAHAAEELYRVVFPAHKRAAPCPASCTNGVKHCVIRAMEGASCDAWDGDPGNTDATPLLSPVVHTSTAAGPDGILAEVLRFSRAEDPTKRHAHRMELCGVLPDIFGRWHAAGGGRASQRVRVPLHAAHKDGDPADPV